MRWEAKCVPLWIKDEHGLPDGPHPLLITCHVLKPAEVKFFLSNAAAARSHRKRRLRRLRAIGIRLCDLCICPWPRK